MTKALARRGPDAEGAWSWQCATLGHRRLAILDLSDAGRQPMVSPDGAVGLVFNGCIYNFQELRRQLEAAGYAFRSQTDTEVILNGYRHWGVDDLVRRMRGMFAFGIWDDRDRKLILVRDRLGVKPLLYSATNGRIAFASTAAALCTAGFADTLSPAAILEFLEFGWVSDQQCIYAGVHKVPAAAIVEWKNGQISQRQYWTLPEAGSRNIRFEETVDATEQLLLDSVRLRLIADVPVGSLLSGGIDSALIAWALTRLNANVTSFTVGTPGHFADETAGARETARLLGIPHEVVEMTPDQQPALTDLTTAYGEPFACSSALGMLEVCKAVKPKVTVLLTGDGGDDVFLGYTHHLNFLRAQRMARLLPPGADRLWSAVRPAVARIAALRRAMHLTDYSVRGLGAVTQVHDGLPYFERAGMLGEGLQSETLADRRIPPSSGRRLMSEFLDYERRTRFVAEYMTKVDGAAMHYAIEARSPFLDHVIWELAAALPFDLRLRRGELKAVLRALARRNVGPTVAARRKQGFHVPVRNWLTTTWRPQLEALMDGPLLEQEGWLAKGALRGAVTAALAAGEVPSQLWTLTVLENWLRAGRSVAAMGRI